MSLRFAIVLWVALGVVWGDVSLDDVKARFDSNEAEQGLVLAEELVQTYRADRNGQGMRELAKVLWRADQLDHADAAYEEAIALLSSTSNRIHAPR